MEKRKGQRKRRTERGDEERDRPWGRSRVTLPKAGITLPCLLWRNLCGESVRRPSSKCALRGALEWQSRGRIGRSCYVNIRARTVDRNCASGGTAGRIFAVVAAVVSGKRHRATGTIEFGHERIGGPLESGAPGDGCRGREVR